MKKDKTFCTCWGEPVKDKPCKWFNQESMECVANTSMECRYKKVKKGVAK